MIMKKQLKNWIRKALLGSFFIFISIFGLLTATNLETQPVYAVPEETTTQTTETTKPAESTSVANTNVSGNSCNNSLGAIGWLVCPTTGKIAEAVDWLYEKIEDILVINPIPAEDGSPIYEIWKYLRGITNIVFIIFLLIVIYSQITGFGINNYGIKKALPKLIIAAILVNLSFIICQLAVDVSNIFGDGLRGVFTAISESAITTEGISEVSYASYANMYSAIGSGTALTIGAGLIMFETGAIWMLIPVVLGALVAVVSGLITIALRQAVVALLIMISPLAMVAYILPNTEKWFTKWKDLLFRMLIFYPMFSLLFGASQLAGFAIIASAKDGFGVLLGTAVEIFPLFFSWSLMKMSGTFLSGINAKLNSLASGPLVTNRAWADSHRQLSRAKYLERNRMPSAKFLNFLAYQRTKREADTDEMNKHRQAKFLAARTLSNYDKDGNLSKRGQKEYDRQALSMRYAQISEMHKGNMNEGFGAHSDEYKSTIAGMKRDFNGSRGVYGTAIRGGSFSDRVKSLDLANMNASDDLKFELARGAKIDFDNATGFQKRVTDAMNAHLDQKAIDTANENYKLHGVLGDSENMARYERMRKIMEGKEIDVHFAAADAASSFNAQSQVMRNKFQTYMDLTAPTQDVVHRLNELTKYEKSNDYIDPIIAGLRTLNMRGDTDLVREQLKNTLGDYTNMVGGKINLGTYASQSLSNFLMFDVKDNDPFLRRFGKYINLETARMYNEDVRPEDRRTRSDVSFYEYVNGEYIDRDVNGEIIRDENGVPKMKKSKRDMGIVLQGTSFKNMERTAIKEMTDAIRDESYDMDADGNKIFNYEKFKKNESKLWNAIMANIIGDQFSFLSGSEQIVALGKGLTGVDVKDHTVDWKGIFGDYADSLTPEQKADYLEFLNKRTKTFLGGHVPVQIARTKTDMLEAIKTQYALRDAIKDGIEYDEDGNVVRVNNPDILNLGFKNNGAGYKQFEEERLEGVKQEFAGSFKEDALQGFGKMYRKGYQGEAKDGLIQLLKDTLDRQSYDDTSTRRSRRRIDDDDDDEGMPVGGDFGDGLNGGGLYNDTRIEVESIFEDYRGPRRLEVEEFWDRAKEVITTSAEMGDVAVTISEIEEGLSQYTDVAQLYERIMRTFFGSD